MVTYQFVEAYLIGRFRLSDRGASLVEYALLVALIAIVCILAVAFLGRTVSSKYSQIGSGVQG